MPSGVITYSSRECSSTWVRSAGAGMESTNESGEERARGSAFACSRTATRSGSFVLDRKSTRLNSSHDQISYAVFCLKKKKNKENTDNTPNSNYKMNKFDSRLLHQVIYNTLPNNEGCPFLHAVRVLDNSE